MPKRASIKNVAKESKRPAIKKKVVTNSASPENPSVPLDPDYWDDLGWLGARTDSGVRMTHQQAIGHPPIVRALNLICRGIAKLPMRVKILGADGEEAGVDKRHPADKLVWKRPNGNMRSNTWKATMLYHALMRGNGYSGIVRKGPNPISLIVLDPIKTEPFWVGDDLWYATMVRGEKRKIPAADMFHLKGLSFDGILGHDTLHLLANAMGMGPAGRKWMNKLLSRGSTAGGLLQLPRELSPEARRKRQEEFEKYQSGLDNAFKTLALEDGAKWIRTMITPAEVMLFDVFKWDVKFVANIFGLPPHKLGDDAKSSHNSLEQENKSFLEDSLDPWITELESEADEKLLSEEEIDSNSRAIRCDRTKLELGDIQSQANAYGKLVNDGLMLADEARNKMAMAPLPGGEGKKLRIPVNIAVDGKVAGIAPAAVPEEGAALPPAAKIEAPQAGLQNAAHQLLVDRLRRLASIDNEGRSRCKNDTALREHQNKHLGRLRDALEPILPILAIANGAAVPSRTADLISSEVATLSLDDQVMKVIELCVATKTPQEES